jgi:hypothetical protein
MRALVLCALAACGYPALDTKGTSDASTTDGHMTDGREQDGTIGPQCDAPAMYGTLTASSQSGDYYPGTGSAADELAYGGDVATTDAVFITLFSDDPKFGGVFTVPVTIPISGVELNFDSCGGCVVVGAKCNGCNPETGAGTASWFMATGGSLRVTEVSPRVKGTLTNVTFEHVTIANTGSNPTYHSTPVGDGCVTKITSMAFDAPVTNH